MEDGGRERAANGVRGVSGEMVLINSSGEIEFSTLLVLIAIACAFVRDLASGLLSVRLFAMRY